MPSAQLAASAGLKLTKPDSSRPAFVVIGPRAIAVRGGVTINGHKFADVTPLPEPQDGFEAGVNYAVLATGHHLKIEPLVIAPDTGLYIGGFHFAPGGNAPARAGGDDVPAINPLSVWDLTFRPACPDPRAMTLVDGPRGRFWCDIYLTGADHLVRGTSAHGVTIADGDNRPSRSGGGRYDNFNYETAAAVMSHHGKQLLSLEEFFAAAFGVTEKTAIGRDPEITGLDAPRTSKFGLMQATGNMWTWGHDGDPDEPRASFFGGSWLSAGDAGSRCADVGNWPGYSGGYVGARGRCDHLIPVRRCDSAGGGRRKR